MVELACTQVLEVPLYQSLCMYYQEPLALYNSNLVFNVSIITLEKLSMDNIVITELQLCIIAILFPPLVIVSMAS